MRRSFRIQGRTTNKSEKGSDPFFRMVGRKGSRHIFGVTLLKETR